MSMSYAAANWFWLVATRPGELYASARFAYFATSDATYQAFLADPDNFPTSIATEAELRTVLNTAGVRYLAEPLPPIEVDRPTIARARVRLVAASFSITPGTPRSIPWTSELLDPLDMHSASPNPERIVIPVGHAGWYRFVAGIRFTEAGLGANLGQRALQIARGLGGSPEDLGTVRLGAAPSPAGQTSFGLTEFVQCAEGDVIRAFTEISGLGALNAVARITLLREE